MFHDPLCTALRPNIDPAGLHIPVCMFYRVARCGFGSLPKAHSRQGGLAALRCILRQMAQDAHYFGRGRIHTASPSSHEVKHV